MSADCLLSNSIFRGSKNAKTFEKIKANEVNTRNIVSEFVSFGDGSFHITPNGSQNLMVSVSVNNDKESIAIYFDVDTSMCEVGDKLTMSIILTNPSVDEVQENIQRVRISLSDKFYLIDCGDVSTYPIDISYSAHYLVTYLFDGEKYVNTRDNC